MSLASTPGFLLVAQREFRWLLRDRVALLLIFGVPLFAFIVLTTVFSHPVIRGLGVTVVGSQEPAPQILLQTLAPETVADGASVIGQGLRVSPLQAALVAPVKVGRVGSAVLEVRVAPRAHRPHLLVSADAP